MDVLKELTTSVDYTEYHPIDLVEFLARQRDWAVTRTQEDQISLVAHGVWRTYQIGLEYNAPAQTLYVVCSFEMEHPKKRMPTLYELLNLVNQRCWCGSFVFNTAQKVVVYRYGLVLTGVEILPDQLDQVMQGAMVACEKYYPAFQLVCWGDETPAEAMRMVFDATQGRA